MDWVQSISAAIGYIDAHLNEELDMADIAQSAMLSPFYFQRGFAMLCGFTVGEYIRSRRLSAAGAELVATNAKIIDLAVKYGYDSADSFTRAFTRFHGATPSAVRRGEATLRSIAPLKIQLTLQGGTSMEYRIVDKGAFSMMGRERTFGYENCMAEIPAFWGEHFASGGQKVVCGRYGVNIDENVNDSSFEYMIADPYDPASDIPAGYTVRAIPAYTWAVFPCKGSMVEKLQKLNRQIFSEWLPANTEYAIATGMCIEMYSDPREYKFGTSDENYYCELWIPVNKK